MTIPPQSVHAWTALFGGISYSAWALYAYFLFERFTRAAEWRISKGKVPRFLYAYI